MRQITSFLIALVLLGTGATSALQGQTTLTITGTPGLGQDMTFEVCAPANHFVCVMFSTSDIPTPITGFSIPEAPIGLPARASFDTTLTVPDSCMSFTVTVPCHAFALGKTVYAWAFSVDLANPTVINSLPVEALTIFDPGNTGLVDVSLFDDLNSDGVRNAGEAAMAGVDLTLRCTGPDLLFGTEDDSSVSGTTDANGEAEFRQVVTGPCRIEFDDSTMPGAKTQTAGFTSFELPPCGDYNLVAGFGPALVGTEGCTPGYWKQTQHFNNWPAAYNPTMLFSDVFEDAFPGLTLLQVLSLGGGGLNALGRHTVAALLNGTSTNVAYAFSQVEVINMFNMLFPDSKPAYESMKDTFVFQNELGCGL